VPTLADSFDEGTTAAAVAARKGISVRMTYRTEPKAEPVLGAERKAKAKGFAAAAPLTPNSQTILRHSHGSAEPGFCLSAPLRPSTAPDPPRATTRCDAASAEAVGDAELHPSPLLRVDSMPTHIAVVLVHRQRMQVWAPCGHDRSNNSEAVLVWDADLPELRIAYRFRTGVAITIDYSHPNPSAQHYARFTAPRSLSSAARLNASDRHRRSAQRAAWALTSAALRTLRTAVAPQTAALAEHAAVLRVCAAEAPAVPRAFLPLAIADALPRAPPDVHGTLAARSADGIGAPPLCFALLCLGHCDYLTRSVDAFACRCAGSGVAAPGPHFANGFTIGYCGAAFTYGSRADHNCS
jgi:hypothetical protein